MKVSVRRKLTEKFIRVERQHPFSFRPFSLKQRVTIDKDIVKIIKEQNVETSRFVTRDFGELLVARKGVRPAQLRVTLECYLEDYPVGSKQRKALQSIIDEINASESKNDLRGKTIIEHVAAVTKNNELTATFVVYQYYFGK